MESDTNVLPLLVLLVCSLFNPCISWHYETNEVPESVKKVAITQIHPEWYNVRWYSNESCSIFTVSPYDAKRTTIATHESGFPVKVSFQGDYNGFPFEGSYENTTDGFLAYDIRFSEQQVKWVDIFFGNRFWDFEKKKYYLISHGLERYPNSKKVLVFPFEKFTTSPTEKCRISSYL